MLGLLPWSGTRDTGKPLWDQTALYVMSADKTMHLSQVRAGFWLHCCCRRPSPRYCAWQQSSSPVSLPDTRSSAFAEPVSPENLGNRVITLCPGGFQQGVKQNWVRTTPTAAPKKGNKNTRCWLGARKAECSRLAGGDVLWYLGPNRQHRNVWSPLSLHSIQKYSFWEFIVRKESDMCTKISVRDWFSWCYSGQQTFKTGRNQGLIILCPWIADIYVAPDATVKDQFTSKWKKPGRVEQ